MTERDVRVGGELKRLRLDQLEPDGMNPRLPPSVQRQRLAPEDLYPYLDRAYDVVSIAGSIARHGYFEAEPLVAVPRSAAYPDSPPDASGFVIVEGNRRLTALKGFTDASIRARLKAPGWAKLPQEVALPSTFPVLVVADRDKAAPILGFRHITRAAPWEPLPQAKYIADLVDEQQRSFADVADLLSRPEAEVRSLYRNYWVRLQAEEQFALKDLDRIDDNFGTFTRAMQNPGVRAFISAPSPRDVDPEYLPLPDDQAERLEELVTLMFGQPRKPGDEDSRRPRPGQKLLDSREITAFGGLLATEPGRRALAEHDTVREAQESLRDPAETLLRALRAARNAIQRTLDDLQGGDDELSALLAALDHAFERFERAGHAGARP